ncbi:YwqJ-related putative deaminase [Clostridium butyricum]|uniref:YwqJ-related putative deaminase n=1 Tax=Clostridium butyricum TaxID=1492 RepID=UPI00346779B2
MGDDVYDVTKGVSNPELSRLDYLRNKYGKLTSEQINNRINLRGEVNDEIDRLYKSGISKRELGSAVAGVLDTKTGKYYFGINDIKGKVPTELHPIIKERIDKMPLETYNSYEKWTLGAGSHAEVYALNEAMLANPNAKLGDFMVYVVRSGKKLKPRGLPMPRCPHCECITDGAGYFPEVLKYGK